VGETGRESGNPQIVLGLLTSIENDSAVTQRKLAHDLGIALGLTNAYLRRCVRKGLVKMREVPLNRYAYYLTPQGFAEKSRLTAEYLSLSLDFFRRARRDCARAADTCAQRGWHRVALGGAGELAEIALLSAVDAGLAVVCVIDAGEAGRRCAGVPVVADLAAARHHAGPGGLDAILLTDTRTPQTSFEALSVLAPGRVVAPRLLGLSPGPLRAEPALEGDAGGE
jgi:DNA-binding MarR family transcriptional regulator